MPLHNAMALRSNGLRDTVAFGEVSPTPPPLRGPPNTRPSCAPMDKVGTARSDLPEGRSGPVSDSATIHPVAPVRYAVREGSMHDRTRPR
jgi:hypothetical protein